MMVKNLYGASPYDVSPTLRSYFIVLPVEPKNLRLLLLSEGPSVKMRFIVCGVSSPQSSHLGGCSLPKSSHVPKR